MPIEMKTVSDGSSNIPYGFCRKTIWRWFLSTNRKCRFGVGDASDPSVYYEMGLSLKSLDRADEAVAAFEKALSIDTNCPEANDARRALEGTRSAGAS